MLTLAGCGYSANVQAASDSNGNSGSLVVSPSSVDFGSVQIGQSAIVSVTLSNKGSSAVEVSQLTVAGQTFSITGQNNLPVTIAPGASYSVKISFTPNASTAFSGVFTAENSAAKPVAQASLAGSGETAAASGTATLTVSPASLNFGNVTVGSSATLPVTLTSTGTSAVRIHSAKARGSGYTVSGVTFPLTLGPQQSVTLNVQAAPMTTGAATGSLTVSSNSSTNSTAVVSLDSTGVAASAPQLTVSPTGLAFGNVAVGSSATQSVRLMSSGTGPLTISAAAVSGTGFTMSGATFPVTLNPSQAVTLSVKFAPTAAGSASGTLTISSDALRHNSMAVSLSGTATSTSTPTLTVSPSSLSFGNVAVGSSGTQSVTLTSSGTAPVTVNSAAISGTGFTMSGATFPVTLNPKQAVTLSVKFAPTATGAVTGSLTIKSNSSTNATATVSLSGTGTGTPTLTVSPSSLSFGNVAVGSSGTQSVTLTSSGTSAVTVNSASISGTGFTVSGATFPVTLNPKQTLTLSVKFAPTTTGAATGSLTINSNSSTNATATVSLSGTGTGTPTLTFSPSSLSFGNVATGSSGTQSVTFTSSGTSAVTVNSASISGTGFTVSGATFPVTLNPKQTLTLTVKFAPTATGAVTGSLTIKSNSSTNATAVVSLSGTGTSTSTPTLTVSPSSLSFGNVASGSSGTQSVTLTSSGTSAVTVNSAAISGTGFSVSGATFPVTLNPKQTVTLSVKFAPTATGAVTGSLTIKSNSSTNATAVVSLSGTGTITSTPTLTVSPGSLSFGNVAVGSSGTQSVTLTSSGTTAVTVNSAAISGTGFTMSGATFPVTLNPKQAVTLSVKFAPTATGAVTGSLTIKSNSSTNATAVVSLSGTGTGTATLTVSPTSLSFGDVTVSSSATLPVTLTSSGTSAVTVNSATISGTGFTVSGATFPVTLNPKQAITLNVAFAPTSTTAATGTLTIRSNSSTNATVTVNLSGTGVKHQVSLSWEAPTSTPVAVAGYSVYRATGGSSSFQQVNGSIMTSTSYVDTTVASGTSYTYYVVSVDSAGASSGPSNEVTVTIP